MLALTAASMIDKDPLFEDYLLSHRALDWALYGLIAGGVLLAGYWRNSVNRAQGRLADAGLVVEALKR